ncbi:MAG TPA: hypothetical protein VFG12_09310, partial [Rhodopila sp.]|nr:hypothetical protein [Rhodopila sp.]
ATLAGRFDDAKPLEDPRLDGSTEIEFWRGYLQASRDAATDQDAARLVQGLPLVLAYPQPLRDRLLPTTLETMALHGQVAQVQAALRGLPDDPTLDLARALALEMTNQPAAALQDYDRIAKGPDRLRRYQAELRAIDLRIKAGQLDAKAGADALDRDLYEWRGARQEQDLRSHIAALRRQAGQWPEALSVLREGRDAFPEDHARMDRELADTFTAFVTNTPGVALSRPELIALFDHNADLVRDIAWDEPTGQRLVDRLTDLGLQARAEPVLQRLVAQSTDPANRARLGARLADLRMTLDNQAGAIAALADTAPPANAAADPSVMETRQLLYAHAESQRGNTDRALTMLAALPTAQADAARADIYTGRKDWPHAEAALSDWEHKAIPTPAQLNDQQQSMVMRLAVAATLTSDSATLARLASTYGAAMQTGHAGAFFRLLTAAPVRDQDDLPRAFQEIQLAQQLVTHPADMETP